MLQDIWTICKSLIYLLLEPTGPSDSSTPPAGDISILLTVEKPEIVLVEDAMNMDTNALILEVI